MVKNIYKYLKIYEELGSKAIEVFRYIFSSLALVFVIFKLKDSFSTVQMEVLVENLGHYFTVPLFVCCLLFAGLHHWSDGVVWQRILQVRINISIYQAIKMNWTSLAYSFYSPNRLLDIPSKVLLLEGLESKFKWYAATGYNLLKPISTFLLGFLALLLLNPQWLILGSVSIMVLSLLIVFLIRSGNLPFVEKWKIMGDLWSGSRLAGLLGLNMIRIVSLSLQHTCILMLLGFNFPLIDLLLHLILIHTVVTFLPQIAGTEIFAKTFLCIYFLNLTSGQEVVLTSAVLLLWCMNVLIPVLFGLIYQKRAELKTN